jgi:Cu(I)/Ag(I) efflux system membrane fusion protein
MRAALLQWARCEDGTAMTTDDPTSAEKPSTPPQAAPPRRSLLPFAAVLLAGVVGGGGAVFLLTQRHDDGHEHDGAAEKKGQRYQCPMHPTVVQDGPGNCPICGMKLLPMGAAAAPAPAPGERKIAFYRSPMDAKQTSHTPRKDEMGMEYLPVYEDEVTAASADNVDGLATVKIDPDRQQLIGLKVVEATVGPIGGALRTTGRVAVDETRVHHLNVKFSGFAEHVHADYVGRLVKKGEPLFSIYSPDVLAAEEEYLLALSTQASLAGAKGLVGNGEDLVVAARRKLELWDVPQEDIARLEQTRKAERTITLRSPAAGVVVKKDVVPGMKVEAGGMPYEIVDLSSIWVLADVYESELSKVKVGTPATFTLKAIPGKEYQGRVTFIDPYLDAKTRAAKVRLAFPNPGFAIKPEMFGEVVLKLSARKGVRVPADAVINSGTRSVVFLSLGDGKFQPREVRIGQGDGSMVEVLEGLAVGDKVVTRANFLVDSESRLKASLQALSGSEAGSEKGGGAHP